MKSEESAAKHTRKQHGAEVIFVYQGINAIYLH